MFWGESDASVSFCESKYTTNKFIAEYYNTVSAIPYIFVGIFYYKNNLKEIGMSIIWLGIGTGILHGTQRFYGQIIDEASMLTLSFNIINKIKERQFLKKIPKKYLYFLLVFYLLTWNRFYIFFTIFSGLQIYTYNLVKYRKNKNNSKSSIYVDLYKYLFLVSFICWLLDQFLCEYVRNYYLHAIWHIGTSMSLFTGLIPFIIN